MARMTFQKRHERYQLADVSFTCTNINVDGDMIGWIEEKDGEFRVKLMVPANEQALQKNPNCPWMWGCLKCRFPTELAAKTFVRENKKAILDMLWKEEK